MTEAGASTNLIAKATRGVLPPLLSATTWMLPAGAGALAGLLLVGLYLGLVSWAQGLSHARDLLWGGLMMVLFWGAIIALLVWAVQSLGRRDDGQAQSGAPPPARTPLEIAKERYARGEIGRDEFEQLKRDLDET